MRVDWAIACRYAEVNGGLATIVGAGIDTYYPPSLPADLSVVLVVRLVGLPDDVSRAEGHELVARVLDLQLGEISSLTTTFGMQPNPEAPPGWESGVTLPTIHTFTATEEGAYTIDLAVDGRSHTVPIIVRINPNTGSA